MRSLYYSLSLAALVAACSTSTADQTTTADAPLSSDEAAQDLWTAEKAELIFGAPPRLATGSFMTFPFWGNEGEAIRIHVDGAGSFDVRTVGAADNCQQGAAAPSTAPAVTTVGSGATDVSFTVARTGYHFVVIGARDATASLTVRVSAAITRRPATKGVKAISMYNAKTCAVLANGEAKCWGTTDSGWGAQPRPGASLASMGAALTAVSLPAKAVDVVVSGPGGVTMTTFVLEDGSVWSAKEEGAPKRIALAAKAKKVSGDCAWLEDDGVQCWSPEGDPSTVLRLGKPVKAMSARTDLCVLLEGDELDCGTLLGVTPVSLGLDADEHVLDMAVGTFLDCVLTNKAVRCEAFQGGGSPDHEVWRADLPGEPVQFLVDATEKPVLVTKEGGLYSLDTKNGRWDPATSTLLLAGNRGVKRFTGNDTIFRITECAIVDDGVVKCAGEVNVGQLGLGDCVNRSRPMELGDNLPGLLLE